MRICLVTNEIFKWGVYGGFGNYTRTLGRELAKRGFEVFVVVPRREEQRDVELLDGMVVLGYSYRDLLRGRMFKVPQADIYHTVQPFVSTYFAIKATPKCKHLVEFQDPLDNEDMRSFVSTGDAHYNNPLKRLYFFKIRPIVLKKAVRRADAVACNAKFLIPKVKRMYNLTDEPYFLPHPLLMDIPTIVNKASKPTVCFLARWDPQKRVERFFHLARSFPEVRFIAAGRATDERRDRFLREEASKIPNLELAGFVDGERKAKLAEESWILVNTSIHEGLPNAFLEACAYKQAILSAENPDDFASNFGYHVQYDDFEAGLKHLLEDNRWKEKGGKGFEYVSDVHEFKKCIEQRIRLYEDLLGREKS